VRAGEWPALRGVELRDRTLGLLGLGRIGMLVAEKAQGLGMRVLAHDPFVPASETAILTGLEQLVAESDFLSLHAPLTEETRGIVSRSLLERLKSGAALINTARGELVDEHALLWALDEGPLQAAALDVLAVEPPPLDHPLLHRDDVIVTPHVSPHTTEATSAMGRMALNELLTVLSGSSPRFAL
jgi:D-3-phosphoglycerate dehydrogenase